VRPRGLCACGYRVGANGLRLSSMDDRGRDESGRKGSADPGKCSCAAALSQPVGQRLSWRFLREGEPRLWAARRCDSSKPTNPVRIRRAALVQVSSAARVVKRGTIKAGRAVGPHRWSTALQRNPWLWRSARPASVSPDSKPTIDGELGIGGSLLKALAGRRSCQVSKGSIKMLSLVALAAAMPNGNGRAGGRSSKLVGGEVGLPTALGVVRSEWKTTNRPWPLRAGRFPNFSYVR